ncbi:MAG: nucleoside-diphosphate-sugar epimerase [Chitinophagales bacterium]|jgi:nucleoside-diphosphate-sugar epimerase
MNVLVTGATGLVGGSLVSCLSAKKDIKICAAIRHQASTLPADIQVHKVGDLGAYTNWDSALKDIQVVIHTAARVHVMNDSASDPLTEFRKVNVEGTLNLARQAAAANVKRFIFISSIKVNGELTETGKPFRADDQPNPVEPYGISKWESEVGLHQLAIETGMEVVIIRPPLVYGPGVKANFLSMMRWVNRGVPLPFGAIHNKRSLVAISNLTSLIVTCIDHPDAANQIFLAGDGEDLSTSELLKRIGKVLRKPARLIPIPSFLLIFLASLLGKKDVAQRLFGSLQVDISKARELLGWEPPVSVDEGLLKTVEGFLN